jgi:hypothetical protein
MCTQGDGVPGDIAEALRNISAALDHLNGPAGVAVLEAAGQGDVLAALAQVSAKLAAARAAALSRFDAGRGHDADGYGSSVSWLAATNRVTRKAAAADVRRMRQLRRHPSIAQALAAGEISESWAAEMAEWTRKLPAELREGVDKLLVDTAAAGANLEDLAVVARTAYERWRQQSGADNDPSDGFDDRYLKLGTTIDNAGRVNGDLTPECTAALQAVLDALGKKAGAEDHRTGPQRFHDALQLACELLIRAQMVPDRAGADTRVDVVIALSQLRDMPGAPAMENAWLAAMAGQHAHLAGAGARAAACDAITTPVVTGSPDLAVVDQMIGIIVSYVDAAGHAVTHDDPGDGDAPEPGPEATSAKALSPKALSPRALSPQARQALRYAIARLAINLVSGPTGLAALLRQGLLGEPLNSKPVILDIGYSDQVPGAIRRAVALRARHCEWPGCRSPLAHCDVHHLRHKSDGGPTSVTNCLALCQFHHDICIHRWNWRLVLHPDGTTTAYGPRGQTLHSHGPPGPPGDHGPPGGQRPPGNQAA